MADPRKPIHRPDGPELVAIRNIAHKHLLRVTSAAAQEIGCTGAAFVLMGIGMWAEELSELDAKAASQILVSLATIFDPNANSTKKMLAEKERRAAVKKLLSALDLEMSEPEGTA